jgi:hypothetical protein
MKPTKKLNSVASTFWLDDDINEKLIEGKQVNYTKLAATQRAIGNFVNIVTGKKIPVVFQSGDNSYTDGKQVVIGSKLDGANFDPAVGLALHEGSHVAFTDFSIFEGNTSEIKNSKFASIVRMYGVDPDFTLENEDFRNIKDLLNYVEDRRIDFKVYTAAPGYRPYYEAMYDKYFNDKIIDKALIKGEKTLESWDSYLFHIINLTNPNRKLSSLKQLQTIWDTIDLANISRLSTTIDALEVAVDVFKIIKHAVAEADAEQAETEDAIKSPSNDSESSNGQPSNSESGDTEFSDSEASGSHNIETVLSPKEADKLKNVIQNQRDFLDGKQRKTGKLSKTQNRVVNAIRESGTEVRTIDYKNADGISIASIDTIVIKKINSAIINAMPDLFKQSDKFKLKMDESISKGIVLGKHLGKKLQVRNSDKTLKTTRLFTGKIDRRLVAELGYANENVFQRIVSDKYKNFLVHISIDASGSMGGKKWFNSIMSAVAIAQAASMTTGIRVQISTRGTACSFSGRDQCVTMYAYDSAHDKMNKIKTYFKYLNVYGCTPEGISFKSIQKDLIQDSKEDEVIFVNYSDGAPSHVYGVPMQYNETVSSGVKYTKKVIGEFRENNIMIISYFISDTENHWAQSDKESFKYMYGIDSNYIDPVNMNQVAKSLNIKFTETI